MKGLLNTSRPHLLALTSRCEEEAVERASTNKQQLGGLQMSKPNKKQMGRAEREESVDCGYLKPWKSSLTWGGGSSCTVFPAALAKVDGLDLNGSGDPRPLGTFLSLPPSDLMLLCL